MLNKQVNITCIFTNDLGDKRDTRWYINNKIEFDNYHVNKGDYLTLKKKMLSKKFDIGISGNYASINGILFEKLCRKLNIKYLINAEGGFARNHEGAISKFLKSHYLQKADYCISSGLETNKYLTFYGVNESKIFTYKFTSLFAKDILINPLTADEKIIYRNKLNYQFKRIFLSCGNFIKRKGYDLFLKSIKNFKDENTAFIIIGSGKEKNKYLEYIKSNCLNNVFIVDFCQKEELFNYLKMADVFFCPSREDIWGLVINEAMANGLPVISSNNVIASKELIDKEYLYDVNNIEEQTNMINKMNSLSNEQLYNIGCNNISKIKDYTIENMVQDFINIFKEVLNG